MHTRYTHNRHETGNFGKLLPDDIKGYTFKCKHSYSGNYYISYVEMSILQNILP